MLWVLQHESDPTTSEAKAGTAQAWHPRCPNPLLAFLTHCELLRNLLSEWKREAGAQSKAHIHWHQERCLARKQAQSLQSCPTLCDPMARSPPGSSVHRILEARILERAAMPSSRRYSWPRDQAHVSCVSCTVGRFLTTEALVKPQGCLEPPLSFTSYLPQVVDGKF